MGRLLRCRLVEHLTPLLEILAQLNALDVAAILSPIHIWRHWPQVAWSGIFDIHVGRHGPTASTPPAYSARIREGHRLLEKFWLVSQVMVLL